MNKCVMAVLDCEAAGPISSSAAKLVVRAVIEAIYYPPDAVLYAVDDHVDEATSKLDCRIWYHALLDEIMK